MTGIDYNSIRAEEDIRFHEVQWFRQPWLWIIILIVPCLCIWAFIQQIILDKPFGNNPASDTLLMVLCIIFGLGLPLLFLMLRLITEIRSDGVYYRFAPFHRSFRKILFEEIIKYEIRTYKPIREYGGWGIRYGSSGIAYNVSGNRGLQLELSGGKKILIGSQRPYELFEAIERVLKR